MESHGRFAISEVHPLANALACPWKLAECPLARLGGLGVGNLTFQSFHRITCPSSAFSSRGRVHHPPGNPFLTLHGADGGWSPAKPRKVIHKKERRQSREFNLSRLGLPAARARDNNSRVREASALESLCELRLVLRSALCDTVVAQGATQ